jgi:hypothetical protein
MRLLEMLTDRFGVFEALAHSTIKLNRCTSADELAMDPAGRRSRAGVCRRPAHRPRRLRRLGRDQRLGLPLKPREQRGCRLRAAREQENQTAAGQSWPRLSC